MLRRKVERLWFIRAAACGHAALRKGFDILCVGRVTSPRRHKTLNKKRPCGRFFISVTVQLEDGHEGFRGNLNGSEVAHLLARWKSFAFQRRFARQFE